MSEVNYKNKYNELKLKFMNSVDMAFRLGYEQGQQEAQMQQMQEAQAQAQAQAEAQQQGMGGEQPGQEQGSEQGQEQAPEQSAHPGGSELDQHISQLEGMLGKGELEPADLLKALNGLRTFRKSQLQEIELKKSHEAISGIAQALHKPSFKLGKQASHNLPDNAKKAVSMQEKIVNDVLKSWENEESKAKGDILSALKIDGVTK